MNVDLEIIGSRIKAARRKRKLSQAELAEQLNISSVHMSKIELGKTNFGVDILMKITEVLQVSADELLRTDVPAANAVYSEEIIGILEGSTQAEKEAMLNTLRDMKKVFRSRS